MAHKSVTQWLDEYGVSHQHPINKRIHWLCVPLIMFSLLAILWDVPFPEIGGESRLLNWASLLVVAAMLFYVYLSLPLAVGMFAAASLMLLAIAAYERLELGPVWQVAVVVFVVAWIGQFIGHKIEGRKPSFFQDVVFLLIGPLWILSFIYRRLGIRYE